MKTKIWWVVCWRGWNDIEYQETALMSADRKYLLTFVKKENASPNRKLDGGKYKVTRAFQ